LAEKELYQPESGTQVGEDSINEWREWVDHQYVPGYYAGGRIPPISRLSRRPSYLGYTLVATGSLFLMMILLAGPGTGAGLWLWFGVGIGFSLLQILAGLRLARGAPGRKRRRDSDKRE
jgi:hypothetical protein